MQKKIFLCILCIILTICISISTIGEEIIFYGNDIKWLFILAVLVIFFNKIYNSIDKRKLFFSLVLGFILSVCYTLGRLASIDFVYTDKMLIVIICKSIVYFAILSSLVYYIFTIAEKYKNKSCKNYKLFSANKKSIVFIAAILFMFYLPYILNYFPGNVLIDSSIQILEGQGTLPFTNHHPVLHTLFIKLCMKLGLIFHGSYQLGAFIYTLIQTIFTCFVFSYTIYYMAKKNIPSFVRVIVLIFYALCPTICFYTVTMYKDIPFSLFILLSTIGTIELITNTEEFLKSKKKMALLFLCITLSMFFRNNGVYAFILMFPFAIIILKKYWKQVLIIYLLPIIIFEIISKPVYKLFKIEQGSPREALSIPIQQFGRLMVYKEDKLTEYEKKKIVSYLPIEDFKSAYMSGVSDPIKNKFNDEAFKKDKAGFFKLYLELAKKYPDVTFQSFILGNYGYYYPNTLGWGVYTGVDHSVFDKYDFKDINTSPVVRINLLNNINTFVNTRDFPIISMFLNIGFLFWILLVCIFYTIYKKNYKYILYYLPVLFVWATILASPIFAEPRYVYCLFTTIPLLVSVTFFKNFKLGKNIKGAP